MRRCAFLLALLLLLMALLVSCGETSGTESSTGEPVSEAAESSDQTETSSHTSEGNGGTDESKDQLVPIADRVQYKTPVSIGCSYTVNVASDEKYADSYNSELTDGVFGECESYSDGRTVGFAIGDAAALTLVIDLGKEYTNLYEFSVSYLHTTEAGIAPPSTVRVQSSSDGEKWNTIGLGKRPVSADANTMQLSTVTAKDFVTARYIRFVVAKTSYWMFFDEFLVFADEEGNRLEKEYLEKVKASYGTETRTTAERAAAIASLKGDAVDRTKYRNELNLDCTYTLSEKPDSSFPDKGGMLSDGHIGKVLESETWVGFDGSKTVDVTMDLKSVRTDLADFAVYAYSNQSSALYPAYIKVSVGDSQDAFTEIGRIYGPTDTAQTAFTYELALENAVKGRFVRFTVCGSGSALMLFEEFGIYGYGEKADLPYIYPAVTLQKEKDKYWNAKGDDATKIQNLILGRPVQIIGGFASSSDALTTNTPMTSRLLTDGKMAYGVDIHEGDFFKFHSGGERNLIFDLTALSSIVEVRASVLSYTDWAVYRPQPITVYLSDDTENWYEVGILSFAADAKDKATNWGSLKLEQPAVARYVCISFDAGTWSASDEMEVLGSKTVAKNAKRLAQLDLPCKTMVSDRNDWKYTGPSEQLLGGVSDICLMYHGTKFSYNEEELLPYVAYLDKEGNILDTMFDGFLFLLSGDFPSGNAGHQGSKMSDWEWLLKDLFAEETNLDALDKVVGRVNEALGTPGRKVVVYPTLYYLRPTVTAFGDVDGDGVNENMSVLADRLKVFKWYLDAFDAQWAEAGFENLTLGGYYWYHEEISNNENDPDEANMIKGAAALLHERGTQFFWIPWYSAPGYTKWASFGFDVACMQPNYAFDAGVPETRLDMATALIQSLGMCLEMEIDDKALGSPVYYDKYMDYLKHGVTDGYMKEAIHMYYQGRTIFLSAYQSNSEKIHAIYDYTYLFIKKKLPEKPAGLEDQTVEGTAGSPVSGNLPESSSVRKYQIYNSPEHGTVTINENGSFVYYPDPGFTGTDSFLYSYSDRLFYSDGCRMTIRIGE